MISAQCKSHIKIVRATLDSIDSTLLPLLRFLTPYLDSFLLLNENYKDLLKSKQKQNFIKMSFYLKKIKT